MILPNLLALYSKSIAKVFDIFLYNFLTLESHFADIQIYKKPVARKLVFGYIWSVCLFSESTLFFPFIPSIFSRFYTF